MKGTDYPTTQEIKEEEEFKRRLEAAIKKSEQIFYEKYQNSFNLLIDAAKKLYEQITKSGLKNDGFFLDFWIHNHEISFYNFFIESEFLALLRNLLSKKISQPICDNFYLFKLFMEGFDGEHYYDCNALQDAIINFTKGSHCKFSPLENPGSFGEQPLCSSKNVYCDLQIKLHEIHFHLFYKAMSKSWSQVGSSLFVSGEEQKKTKLQELMMDYNKHFSQKDWPSALHTVTKFVKLASQPRGGWLNLYKANYGETRSANAFYSVLKEHELGKISLYMKEQSKNPNPAYSEFAEQWNSQPT